MLQSAPGAQPLLSSSRGGRNGGAGGLWGYRRQSTCVIDGDDCASGRRSQRASTDLELSPVPSLAQLIMSDDRTANESAARRRSSARNAITPLRGER